MSISDPESNTTKAKASHGRESITEQVMVQVKCIASASPSTETHIHWHTHLQNFYSKVEHRGFVLVLGGAEGACWVWGTPLHQRIGSR